ncbi:protein dachsous-like [Branchiostoma floridae]|uniref:Protein dachsous-like n=1 Tax=Branchiostoma floridae TaxID=7739 RepID=A0A9J7MWJ6_BRAFL|nr:protein dachsous-like [Branchiostoma floridae]
MIDIAQEGLITVAGPLNSGVQSVHNLVVSATDGGGLVSQVNANVAVSVIGTGEMPPVFSQARYSFSVPEDAARQHTVGTVMASHSDPGKTDPITYSIHSGDRQGYFAIDPTTGRIYTQLNLDHETVSSLLLNIQASSGNPPVYGRAQVNITILDINDNRPEFTVATESVAITENVSPGTIIFVASAQDQDAGSNGLVRYSLLNNQDNLFSVNSISGEVKILRSVDADDDNPLRYELKIMAHDQGTPQRFSNLTLLVIIQDENDNGPMFSPTFYDVQVPESASVNYRFLQVTALDRDSGLNEFITYYLSNSADSPNFGMFPDGWLYVKHRLDRELRDSYFLQVVARDNGSPPRNATANVRVTVTDDNDNDPRFTQESYHFSLVENLPTGTTVGTVFAVDADIGNNGDLDFSIIPNNSSFIITTGHQRGVIKTKRPLDRETTARYDLVLKVRDRGTPPRTATATLHIVVEDMNDNAPYFSHSGQYLGEVEEHQPNGTEVIRVLADDPDNGENGTITYRLVTSTPGMNGEEMFNIHSQSGLITTNAPLDREQKPTYVLSVAAVDGGTPPRERTTFVHIHVTDSNDNAPVFVNSTISIEVEEGLEAGSTIGSVHALDNDEGENGRVSYEIMQGNLYGTFGVDRNTGRIFTAKELDFELNARYRLIVQAQDNNARSQKSSTIYVNVNVIDINDNAPTFRSDPVMFGLQENTAVNSTVWTFSATDVDSGRNGAVRYRIMDQLPNGNNFRIDSVTGALQTTTPIDREQTSQFTLVVEATDQPVNLSHARTKTTTARILVEDVNDNTPVFVSRTETYVMEDEPVGYHVMYVIAVDDDFGDNGRVTYQIVSGNQGGKFLLDPNTGLLAIERRLDRETESRYVLNITATDHGTPSRSASHLITIHVRDVNDNQPRFLQDTYQASVSENQSPGTSVIQITALDADAGTNGVLTYNIPRGVAEDRFTIEEQTGVIRTAFRLDREEKDSYIVTAYARDGAYPSRFGFTSVVVSVLDTNDHAPVFKDAEYMMTVPENQPNYGVIHTVVAYDADIGTNGQVRYEIIDGNVGGKFAVDAVTGELSVISDQALDRETVPLYHLIVQAHDNTDAPRTSTTNITVAVSDENDNNPIFTDPSYQQTIQEDVSVGSTVIRVTAQDRDEGVNGEVFYFLSNETNGMFRIDNTSGIITTTRLLDREKQSVYSFDAYASDRGPFGPRTSNVRVTVDISDVNDNAPVFTQVPFETTIERNIGVNQQVVTVTAEDKDTGSNAEILYRFDSSNANSQKFNIGPQSGIITTQVSLVGDSANIFRLQVIAEDQGSPAKSSTGLVVITMSDSSMTTLRFDNGTYSAYISENAIANTDIISVSASREDGQPASVTYSFASGNDDESFEINPTSGLITVKDSTNLDFETAQRVRLIVTAQATTPSLYGYATVWVNLRDENDNAPRFDQDRYTTSVWEGNDRGMFVIQVSATDADSGTNSEVQYSIVSGNHDNAFVIDRDRGIISTNVRMDREVRDSYRLELRAVDKGTPRLTGSATLRISVVDINDNRPTFPEPYPPVNVLEGAEVGSELALVTANDIDTDPTITYTFTTHGNPGGVFSIDRYSGKVTLAQPLDRESVQSYIITIMASDEVHTDQTNVEINVLDENDNPPVFDQQTYQVDIAEMVPPHYSVATVTATDRDAGSNAEITYSMTVAPVEGFYVDPRNGTIFTNKTIEINRMQSTIQLVIEARDHGVPSLASVVAVRIQVNDINNHAPQFTAGQYEEHVSEAAPRGTTVATVTATDADQSHDNSNIHFGIVQGNEDGKFQIETIEPSPNSDQYMGKIILFQAIDREEVPMYTLRVLASDRGTPERNSTVTVYVLVDDVNDHSPIFNSTQYVAQISEEAVIGAFVVRVFAFDADSGPNADIHYEITSGNDDSLFAINSQSGVITVANPLDYDTVAQHNLTIRAKDSTSDGAKHTITSVLINLIDENDNPPDFPVLMYLEDVPEGRPVGTLVFTAEARDKDAGIYGTLSYVILDRDVTNDGTSDVAQGKDAFEIDSSTGEVRTREVFDYETQNTYGFYIRATDTGGLSTDVQVGVSIQSVDEFPPVFTQDNYIFTVIANADVGTFVGQVEATDADGGPDGIVSYSIRNDKFAINESGVITVKASLLEGNTVTDPSRRKRRQAENEDQINLIVEASSGRPGSLSEQKAISVKIDRSCPGCNPSAQSALSPLTPLSLALILIFALIAVILCVVLIVLKFKRRKQRPPPTSFDGSFDTVVVQNTHSFGRDGSQKQSQQLRMFKGHPSFATADNSADMGTLTRTDISEHSNNSQSSGRGSSEVDEDEEIRKINETPASISPNSDQHKVREIPDSGIQHDEDAMSEMSVKDTADLISRLAVTSNQGSQINTMISKSVESMHVFRDEGGGEAGGDMDIGNLIHQKLHEVGMEENEAIMDGTRDFVLIDDGQPSVAGSLSSIVASEEELRGSYNWDYLLDWGPQYQPMADVFLEIAKLKDETVAKRQIHHPKSAFTPKVRTHPPPLITNLPQSSVSTIAPIALGGSSRTSQATSISSLPRSPISHESTFTSPALTPSFSPSLSPLATRSPSVSPLVTGPNSGASTPHRRSAYSSTFMTRVPSPTGSEQELRI